MNKRIDALKEIINLAEKYQISVEEINVALSKQNEEIKQPKTLIYSGIILIFTAIIMLLSNFWSLLPNELKIFSTLVTGIIAYYFMIKTFNIKEYKFISQPLAVFSTTIIALGTLLSVAILLSSDNQQMILGISFFFMACHQLFTFLYLRTTTSVFFIILFTTLLFLVLVNYINIKFYTSILTIGLSYIFISLYLRPTTHQTIVFLGLFFGSLFLNSGYFLLTKGTILEYILLLLMLLQLNLGIKIKSKALIFVNIGGMIFYLLYLTHIASLKGLTLLFVLGIIFMLTAIVMRKRQKNKITQE